MPTCGAAALPAHEIVAPGDDMRPGDGTEFLRPDDTRVAHEVSDRVLVGTPGVKVGDIREPLDLRWHVGQAMKLGGGQQSLGRGDLGRQLGVGWRVRHGGSLFFDKIGYQE
jgi:hypothetical protein